MAELPAETKNSSADTHPLESPTDQGLTVLTALQAGPCGTGRMQGGPARSLDGFPSLPFAE